MQRVEALLMAALGGLVGSAVSGGAVYWLMQPTGPDKRHKSGAEVVAEAENTVNFDQRLRVLERQQGIQRGPLQPRIVPNSGGAGATPAPAAAATQEGGGDPVVDNPVFEAAVRDLIDRIEEEREGEREIERSERRRQWSEQWATDLSAPLKLNDAQKAKMQEIATQFFERLRELRNSDAGPRPSREERRTQMSALRDEAEAKIGQVLDPGQMSTYKSLEEDQRLGGRFGREFRRRSTD